MNPKGDAWIKKHAEYEKEDWIDKPSLFAETAVAYFPKSGRVLDLGAGQGQDSRFFAEHGYEVVSTDNEDSALQLNRSKTPEGLQPDITIEHLDLREPFKYSDASFDVVYAHLSLHYFDDATTKKIFAEIYRVLKPGGMIAFFTNSTGDSEYGEGKQLEPDYFYIHDKAKRFLSVESARAYAEKFEMLLADNQGETYKDRAKGVHNLIRYIGRKPA